MVGAGPGARRGRPGWAREGRGRRRWFGSQASSLPLKPRCPVILCGGEGRQTPPPLPARAALLPDKRCPAEGRPGGAGPGPAGTPSLRGGVSGIHPLPGQEGVCKPKERGDLSWGRGRRRGAQEKGFGGGPCARLIGRPGQRNGIPGAGDCTEAGLLVSAGFSSFLEAERVGSTWYSWKKTPTFGPEITGLKHRPLPSALFG